MTPSAGPSPCRIAAFLSDPDLAALARSSFSAPGYHLIEADPGDPRACASAAQAAEACLIDEGPGQAGLALIVGMQDRSDPPPVVFVARHADPALDRRALRQGAAAFLEQERLDAAILERTVRYTLAQRLEARRISWLAQYDALTGLANRSLFEDRLGRALARARRSRLKVAVMVLDLNGFKAVNDQLGHPAGDRLLKIIAARLAGRLRETDTIARLGGDEFALVIENLARPSYAALVARKVMDAVVPPTTLGEQTVQVTASLGVALYPDDGATGPVLLERADQAMYRAKSEGGHRCRFCRADPHAPVHSAGLLDGELEEALADGLELRFRPQMPLAAGRGMTVAAVPSWPHPVHGTIDAERFLPLAEDAGLLARLMDWILDTGCEQLRRWRAVGFADLRIALPLVSRRQLAWDDLPARVERAIGELDPAALELEVPEDLVLADLEARDSGLGQLRACGVRIALAGSGPGALPLAPLGTGTIDTVKLSLAGLPGLPDAPGPAAILGSVLRCAGEVGIRTVAAGEASPASEGFLREHGCCAIEALPSLAKDDASAWLSAAFAEDAPDLTVRRRPALAG